MIDGWSSGRWVGASTLGGEATARLASVAAWDLGTGSSAVDVVVDASALDSVATGAAGGTHRTVLLVADGRRDPQVAARSGAAVAAGRAVALRDASLRRTTNIVVIGGALPAATAASAPVTTTVDVGQLVHVIDFFLDPANDYVTGQVVQLLGGDDAWSL